MPTYVIINRPPAEYRPSEVDAADLDRTSAAVGAGKRSAEAARLWIEWFAELGDSLVDRGNPVFTRDTVGVVQAESVLGGYTLVSADNLAAAVRLAQNCPAVQQGGGAEIGELTMLNAGRGPA